MTIHDLRKIVQVIEYNNFPRGAEIIYTIHGGRNVLFLRPATLASELISISSIDDEKDITSGYALSQWDALNLAIRHEYAKYIESDIMDSDLGKAINNITK